MIKGSIVHAENSSVLFPDVARTSTAWERMRGLLGRVELNTHQGLLIAPCPSVHTIGMRYAIDVIYMDKNGVVIKIVSSLQPMRMSSCRGAYMTLEVVSGQAEVNNIRAGDSLLWKPV